MFRFFPVFVGGGFFEPQVEETMKNPEFMKQMKGVMDNPAMKEQLAKVPPSCTLMVVVLTPAVSPIVVLRFVLHVYGRITPLCNVGSSLQCSAAQG